MKKKLLFLVVCTLLLLFAVSAPALADSPIYLVDIFEPAPMAVDQSTGYVWFVDKIPAGSQVFWGWSWRSLNKGVVSTVPDIFRMELSITGPGRNGTVRAQCDQSDCRSYWSELFRWNDTYSENTWLLPLHPTAAAAGLWARHWWVPCGSLRAGTYAATYREILTRTVADPWTYPGPVEYLPYDTGVVEYTFTVG